MLYYQTIEIGASIDNIGNHPWYKWTISAPGIIINNPEFTLMKTYIKLVTKTNL